MQSTIAQIEVSPQLPFKVGLSDAGDFIEVPTTLLIGVVLGFILAKLL